MSGDSPRASGNYPRAIASDWGWQHEGLCRGVDTNMFYLREGESLLDRQRRERFAKNLCATCPVNLHCALHALRAGERHGIWGGLDPKERHELAVTIAQMRRQQLCAGQAVEPMPTVQEAKLVKEHLPRPHPRLRPSAHPWQQTGFRRAS